MPVVAHCPGKVNLTLRVLGRRPDGYHELDTVFQAIDLFDTLEARPLAEGLTLAAEGLEVLAGGDNLVLRAARLLQARYHPSGGAAFHLLKRIPVGGGLGGGSSDAAGALLLLDRLWGLRAGRADLEEAARELGADVAFFLTGGLARGTGRGDRIEPLPFPGPRGLLLGVPPFGIPTAEVYLRLSKKLTPRMKGVTVSRFSTLKLQEEDDFGVGLNDLEDVVFDGWPEVRAFRDALIEVGARRALVSGSGATVFGVFDDDALTRSVARELRRRFPRWLLRRCRTTPGGVRVSERVARAR